MKPRLLAAIAVLAAATASFASKDRIHAAGPEVPAAKLSQYKVDPDAPGAGGANFTGTVKVTGRFPLNGGTRLKSVSAVSFGPGGRTRWHSHPFGQLLVVTHGRGWIQAEGEPVRAMQTGDMIWTAPNVLHWHGATRSSGVSHAAISEQVDGVEVSWKHAVSDVEYNGPM